jgi:hypothetical protein
MLGWSAFRIMGSSPERYDGTIWANTEAEALQEAYAVFKCVAPADKAKVFVRKR